MAEDKKEASASAEETALKRIAPIISHEIRNPLAVIANSAYFIKAKLTSGSALDPKIEKHLAIIESEIRRADATLGEILSFARMGEPQLQEHRLNGLIEEALAGLDIPASIRLEKNLASGDPKVRADAKLFCPAIRHVVRNAVEALAQNPGALRIQTSVKDGKAFVSVSDSGPGVAPEAASNLFVPFFTTKPRGLGLGLAFVRKVMGMHLGGVELEKTEAGASFVLFLPNS